MSTKEPIWKRLGFESLTKYRNYLAKKKGFETYTKYLEHLAIQQGFESYSEYNKYNKQKRLCKSLQNIVSKSKEPDSLFAKNKIDFLRKISGCKIPTDVTKEKKEQKNDEKQS